jgi:uncharacterized protein YjbI with pentapeptide repeats
MAKKKGASALNRLAGKRVVFSGKFAYGVEETLKAMAEAQQATVLDDLTDKVDYLVLADLSAGKTIQKKATSLNAKGAAIQVMEPAAFRELVKPTEDELLAILQDGTRGAEALRAAAPSVSHRDDGVAPECPRLVGARLDGLDLSGFDFGGLAFENCTFLGAKLDGTRIVEALRCDFSKATGAAPRFGKIDCSRFAGANFSEAEFWGHLAGSDFTSARLDKSSFSESFWGSKAAKQPSDERPRFTKASLRGCLFDDVVAEGANFDEADLTGAAFKGCHLEAASFRNVKAPDVLLVAADLRNADLTNVALAGANLAEADLTGATLAGADLTNVNLRGATLKPGALKGAKGVTPTATAAATAGPALAELDSIFNKATKTVTKARISFRVSRQADDEGAELSIMIYSRRGSHFARLDTAGLDEKIEPRSSGCVVFSQEILQAGRVFGQFHVRFETVEVSGAKSPKGGKELLKLVMRGIAEAFGQDVPAEDSLAAAAKAYRDAQREKAAGERQRRKQAKAAAEKQKEKAKKQIAKQVEKAVGKVTDVATFLKALELRIERPKIDKATKMLKASGFKLFNDVSDQCVSGVVKSQTDPDLVYACRIDHEGQYSCCTQNLNVCGGLRGSICKHLLVLIVGLVQAGELDPNTIDSWIAKSLHTKAALDKENMGAIFIKYKGAEAGEVDWRPTETVPEDYYAL